MRQSQSSGFTLIEVLVSVVVMSVLLSFAAVAWQRLHDQLYVWRLRQLLITDLQTARVLALERQSTLLLTRLTDCAWISSASTDWSCGWKVTDERAPSTATALLISYVIDRAVKVSASQATLQINQQGDLVGVGARWSFSPSAPNATPWLLCVNVTGRVRTLTGDTCS